MQKYQNQVEQDLIDQTIILSKLISSKAFLLQKNYDELQKFGKNYLDNNKIDGIKIYNNKIVNVLYEDKKYYLKEVVDEDVIEDVLQGKQIAKYTFLENSQIYWVAQPISSKSNEKVILGALIVYKIVPVKEAKQVAKILDSYRNYSQIKFFSEPVKNSYKVLLILMTLLVCFAGVGGSLVYAKNITNPLEQLALASEKVSKGDLDIKIDIKTDDEIGVLVEAFNEMTQKLKQHTEELKSKNKILSEMYVQISKDKQYIDTVFKNVNSALFLFDENKRVVRINDKAEYYMKNRDLYKKMKHIVPEFIEKDITSENLQVEVKVAEEIRTLSISLNKSFDSENRLSNIIIIIDDITELVNIERVTVWKEMANRIAHEIKNPLTPIKLNAERMLRKINEIENKDLQNTFRNSLSKIINESEDLYNLVYEFSSFSKADVVKKEKFSLNQLLNEIFDLYSKNDKGIEIKIFINEDIEIFADKMQIKRVFLNLINNAFDSIKEKGLIKIMVEKSNGKNIKIVVEDNGCGIKESEISKIFLPYFSTKPKGTGLGLAIVKKIIENHNGKVSIKSSLNEFTRVLIVLPIGF
jgi:two-component system nitrogen regulation sensor histidine kinase NtrY